MTLLLFTLNLYFSTALALLVSFICYFTNHWYEMITHRERVRRKTPQLSLLTLHPNVTRFVFGLLESIIQLNEKP